MKRAAPPRAGSQAGRVALVAGTFVAGAVAIAGGGALYGAEVGRALLITLGTGALIAVVARIAWASARSDARHRRIQDAVHESEARRVAILESALDAIVSLDGAGAILEFNPAAERMFGRAEAEVTGRCLADVIASPAQRTRCRDNIARHFARSEDSVLGGRIELVAVRADGSEFPAEVSVARVNRDDTVTYTSFIRDVSDAQRARLELVRSHERLRIVAAASSTFAEVATTSQALLVRVARTIAELVGDGCLLTMLSEDGRRLRNAASAHRDAALASAYDAYLAGLPAQMVDGGSVAAQVVRSGAPLRGEPTPEEMVERSEPALRPIVARLNVHAYAVVPIRVRQRILGTLSVLRSTPVPGYTAEDVTLLEDLAERAGLAIENARLYDQLEERVRERTKEMEVANRELEAFSYSVAHDLRAPLRGIAGFSQAVLEDYTARLDPAGVEHLRRIDASARRMGELIDDLLQLAKVSRVELVRRRVDLSERARAVIAELRANHPARSIEVAVADGLIVQADRTLLDAVLTNLIGNAWKFTSKAAQPRIELSADLEATPPVFVVRDNGAGFDAAYGSKLFGVFERLHAADEFEGTGIGLAIVQRIIGRHGGRIWAEGRVGDGAAFYFTLEADRAAAP